MMAGSDHAPHVAPADAPPTTPHSSAASELGLPSWTIGYRMHDMETCLDKHSVGGVWRRAEAAAVRDDEPPAASGERRCRRCPRQPHRRRARRVRVPARGGWRVGRPGFLIKIIFYQSLFFFHVGVLSLVALFLCQELFQT